MIVSPLPLVSDDAQNFALTYGQIDVIDGVKGGAATAQLRHQARPSGEADDDVFEPQEGGGGGGICVGAHASTSVRSALMQRTSPWPGTWCSGIA
jgi:hypothetical protein